MDHMRWLLVEKSSKRTFLQLMGSIKAGWRTGAAGRRRPPRASLPMILPGPTMPMSCGVHGVDETDVAVDPAAFPADLGDGIVGHVGRSRGGWRLFRGGGGCGCEFEGAGEIIARGDEDFAAAEDGAAVNGLLDGGGVLGCAVAGGAVVADVETKSGGFCGSLRIGLWFRGRLGQ